MTWNFQINKIICFRKILGITTYYKIKKYLSKIVRKNIIKLKFILILNKIMKFLINLIKIFSLNLI